VVTRIGFVTCVRLGLDCIEEIYRVGGRLDAAITLHDDRARGKSGRVYLDEFCACHGLRLEKIRHVNDATSVELLRALSLDWLFIIGWSQIASPEVLASVRRGVLGMHPTLLPQGRGRAAIPWAILRGLPETGVTLFQLDAGVDTGPIVAQERIPIDDEETASTLYDKVCVAHRQLIGRVWADLIADRVASAPQNEADATVWPGRTPQDGLFVPAEMSVADVHRLVRATTRPYPGAFTRVGDRLLRVWAGRVGGGNTGRPVLVCRDGTYDVTDFTWESPGA
jgi:methionyl-tRNA formyltransferase